MLGASGSLGRAVCAAAERLLPGVRLRRASRRGGGGADAVRADLRDPPSLRRALAGADVAIDAVGPFEYDPAPLVAACREAGCALVDLADRAPFLSAAEASARAEGVPVASGSGAAPGLVEAVAAALAPDPEARALRAWLSVGSRKPVSAALLYALLRPLGRRGAEGVAAPGPVVERAALGVPFWFGRHPWPRGAEGARLGSARLAADYRIGMDHRGQARALRALAPLLGRLPEAALRLACRAVRPGTRAITRLGAARGMLAVETLDAAGAVRRAVEILAPQGLDLAAVPAVWAAHALLAERPAGPVTLAELAAPGALAAWMQAEGWRVTGL